MNLLSAVIEEMYEKVSSKSFPLIVSDVLKMNKADRKKFIGKLFSESIGENGRRIYQAAKLLPDATEVLTEEASPIIEMISRAYAAGASNEEISRSMSRIYDHTALNMRKRYLAFINAGFSPEQAIKLVEITYGYVFKKIASQKG